MCGFENSDLYSPFTPKNLPFSFPTCSFSPGFYLCFLSVAYVCHYHLLLYAYTHMLKDREVLLFRFLLASAFLVWVFTGLFVFFVWLFLSSKALPIFRNGSP